MASDNILQCSACGASYCTWCDDDFAKSCDVCGNDICEECGAENEAGDWCCADCVNKPTDEDAADTPEPVA
jgi:hypothetical protein